MGEDNHRADLARRIPGVEVFAVNFVIPWPDTSQVNLSALPTALPVLNALVDFLLDLRIDQAFDIGELDTALLSAMKLLPEVLVALLGIGLGGVNPLLGNSSESAPSEFVGENLLGLSVNTTPDRLQLLVVREEMEVSANDIGDLLGLAKRVSERDGKTVLRDVSDGSTSLLVTPDGPSRIDPTSVRSIAILGNQLRD